jgi:hypothetical protein
MVIRHESEAVLQLKGLNPGNKLPHGILAGGKPAIQECKYLRGEFTHSNLLLNLTLID